MKPKTVIEWLRAAKTAGLPWADAALRNCESKTLNWRADSLSQALASAFSWTCSPEGSGFWTKAYTQLIDWKPPASPRNLPDATNQRRVIFRLMKSGKWATLEDLAERTGFPTQSVSARLRDFRKAKFGGHIVERRAVKRGLFEYRVIVRKGVAK